MTLTNKNKIPELFFRFRFRNQTERKSQIPGYLFIFACNCFCEDGKPFGGCLLGTSKFGALSNQLLLLLLLLELPAVSSMA